MFDKLRFIWFVAIGLILSLCLSCGVKPELAKKFQIDSVSVPNNLYLPDRLDFRIAVISDLNSQYGSTEYEPEVKQAIALIRQWQPDLVLCGGDAIAGQKKSLTKTQIESMWTAFDRHIAQPLRQDKIPFGFTIGNHDGSSAIKEQNFIFQQERELARAYWMKHQQELGLNFIDRANYPFYYSFEQNDIFFLVWDASSHNLSDTQLEWIKTALKSEKARQSKTKIVIGHLPLYPIARDKNKPGEYLARGDELRSLLQQNRVQMYISGHHHAYYPGKIAELQLLHAGALGQGARQLMRGNLAPEPTITIVDLELATSQATYTTYNAQTWNLIDIEKLPKSITGNGGNILRHDL